MRIYIYIYIYPWRALLIRRCMELAPGAPPWEFSVQHHQEFLRISKQVGKMVTLCVVKSWANSWCTTTRYHEVVRWPCIWGCEGKPDSLSHYLCCHHFWSVIASAARLGVEVFNEDPRVKLCLLNPSPLWANLIAVAHQSYHAIKFSHRDRVQECVDSGSFHGNRLLLEELAKHFVRDSFSATKMDSSPSCFLTATQAVGTQSPSLGT